MQYPTIIRKNFGWYKRKFGILLDNLKPHQKNILLENPLLKDSAKSDQFLLVLFKIYEMERKFKSKKKVYKNPFTKEITDYYTVQLKSKYIDWNCAICDCELQSEIGLFDMDNLLCGDCYDVHRTTPLVDKRILYNSLEFRKFCQKLLKKQQNNFMSYIRKSTALNH